jgi:hypothetical protein
MSTAGLRARLQANGEREGADEERPVVRLFTPLAESVWLLSRIDAADADKAFGLCDDGRGQPYLGHVSLVDLASRFGHLSVRWDEKFEADRSLSAYADEAMQTGRIPG